MSDNVVKAVQNFADELLACPQEQLAQWLPMHNRQLTLVLLQELKERSDKELLSAPNLADIITTRILIVAQHMPQEPLAIPFACWARGNWELYHHPQQAIALYQQAFDAYREIQNVQITVRLLSNLIFATLQCGQYAAATAAYTQALPLLDQLTGPDQIYLVPLNLNYGLLLHEQGRFPEALQTHERARTLAQELQQFDVVVDTDVNRALTLEMMGRLAEAEEVLLQSRKIAIAYQQWLTVARIDMNLGELYVAQGRPAEGLRTLQVAREQFATLGNSMEVGSVLLREADLLAQIGALPDARRGYDQAKAQFVELQLLPEIGKAVTKNALVNRRYGEYQQAAQLLDEAEKLWQTLEQPIWQTFVQQERIELALAQDEMATALALLQASTANETTELLSAHHRLLLAKTSARQWQTTGQFTWQQTAQQAFDEVLLYAEQAGERWLQRQALVGLGTLLLGANDAVGVIFLERALKIDETMRQALSVEELKASFAYQHSDVLPLLVRYAVHQEQPWQALSYLWHAKGDALLDLLQSVRHKEVSTSQTSITLAAEIAVTRKELAHHRWQAMHRATAAPSEPVSEPTNATFVRLEQHLAELRRRQNHALGQMGELPLDNPTVLLSRIMADVLIEYIICDDQVLAIRVDCASATEVLDQRTLCQAFWLCPLETALDLLDKLHLMFQNVLLQSMPQRAASIEYWLNECKPLLQQCYELLVAPVQNFPPGAHLLIAPCESLHLLPFAAFWDGANYLAERHKIELTPTAALCAVPPLPVSATSPLIIAASVEGRLTAIQTEVAAIQSSWPEAVCQLDDPNSLAYLAKLTSAPRILHLATHTHLREDTPLFTALHLVGGMLSVNQCYELPLQGTELVTLSSCKTTSGMDTGGALLALQSAFFIAGAQQVLTSMWSVDDQATAYWMQHFYAHLATPCTPSVALHRTQQDLFAHPVYRHPAFWAAFACYRR